MSGADQIAIIGIVATIIGTIYTVRGFWASKKAQNLPTIPPAKQSTFLAGVITMESFFITTPPPEPNMAEAMYSGQLGADSALSELVDPDSHIMAQFTPIDPQDFGDLVDAIDAAGDVNLASYLNDIF